MSDVVIGSLRLRGPLAGRLARVAATSLPAALDAALAGYPDGQVDAVSVPFTVDAGLDDATIAALWAEAIRAAVHEVLGPPVPGAPPAPPSSAARGWTLPTATATDAVRAALTWWAGGARRDAVPRDAWLVTHPRLVDECQRLLAGRWAVLVTALAEAAAGRSGEGGRRPAAVPPFDQAGNPGARTGTPGADDPVPPGRRETPAPGGTASEPVDAPTADRAQVGRAGLAAALAVASTVADLLDESTPTTIDTSLITTTAGLVLLYPWLADHCRAAEGLHPGLDAGEVRAHALAALVATDPTDPADPADPLVVRLAGLDHPVGHPAPLTRQREVVESADAVLRSFAALLPGFGGSSPEFVRREWVRRTGLLDEHHDPARLTAATRPLDVVLDHLPYPLGLFALPWCPPLAVRFRP